MKNDSKKSTRNPVFLTCVEVERLFGRYNYRIEIPLLEPTTLPCYTE